MQAAITGEKVVAVLSKRVPKADTYHRRRDEVVRVDRQMLVWLQASCEGAPQLLWNGALLKQLGLPKAEMPAELSRSSPAGAEEVSWEA